MPETFSLSHENEVSIENFPYRWVPLLSFFDPDVPGFPLYRMHIIEDGTRVFGVPVTLNVVQTNGDGTCTISVKVLSNCNLNKISPAAKEKFELELKERIGLADALTEQDLIECCSSPVKDGVDYDNWKKIVRLIFPRLKEYYGDRIPCGRFFPKSYGLFRLVSTWNVPGGAKQEIIMTSNLLLTAGREVLSHGGLRINLGLLPTYNEIMTGEFTDFPKFGRLSSAIKEFGDKFLTREYVINDTTSFYILADEHGVPNVRERWDALMAGLSRDTVEILTQLKEDMNRNYQRPFILVVYLYNALKGVDFSDISGKDYARIQQEGPRGVYPKVLAMILQQAWGNYETIPIDTWVETFFWQLLGLSSERIADSGTQIGKFERFIWYTAQLRKNNQPMFNDIIHCIKTGILHSDKMIMREPNPLSCRLCSLSREGCPAYEKIKSLKTVVIDRRNLNTDQKKDTDVLLKTTPRDIEDGDNQLFAAHALFGDSLEDMGFIIITKDGEANSVYKPASTNKIKWERIDDMSPFTTHIKLKADIKEVREIVTA